MGLREFMIRLEQAGVQVKEYQIRYLIRAGKLERPDMDPSHRLRFSDRHLLKCQQLFSQTTTA